MKIYFWNGSEFKNTSAPCLEIHFRKHRYKFGVIRRFPKNGIVLFYKERL